MIWATNLGFFRVSPRVIPAVTRLCKSRLNIAGEIIPAHGLSSTDLWHVVFEQPSFRIGFLEFGLFPVFTLSWMVRPNSVGLQHDEIRCISVHIGF